MESAHSARVRGVFSSSSRGGAVAHRRVCGQHAGHTWMDHYTVTDKTPLSMLVFTLVRRHGRAPTSRAVACFGDVEHSQYLCFLPVPLEQSTIAIWDGIVFVVETILRTAGCLVASLAPTC